MRRRELKKTDGLWMALWLSLVTWAPLFIVRQSNPAASGIRLLAAPGIALGAWLHQCASASLPEILRQRLVRSSFFVGALLTLYSVIPEWALFLLGPLGERTASFFGSGAYAAFRGVLAATQGGALLLLGICLGYCLASRCEPLPKAQVPTASSPAAYASLGCCASLLQLWLCQRADGQPYSPGIMALCELAPIVLAACLSPLVAGEPTIQEAKSALFLALGSSIPCLLTRVLPYNPTWAPAYKAALVLSLAGIVAALFQRFASMRNEQEEHSPARQTNDVEAKSLTAEEILAAYPLAPRELEISAAYAEGGTSSEIAQRLGIKPSTVRATMQRAYKKLGVANREEFLALTAPAETTRTPTQHGNTTPHGDSKPEGLPESTRAPLVHGTLIYAEAIFAALFLLIAHTSPARWGMNRPLVYGVALGLLSLLLAPIGCKKEGGPSSLKRNATLFSLLGLAFIAIAHHSLATPGTANGSIALVGSALGTHLALAPALEAVCTQPATDHERQTRKTVSSSWPLVVLALPAFFLGFSWEELCRGTIWFSLFPTTTPFLVICATATPFALYKEGERLRAALATAAIALALVADFPAALLVCGALGIFALGRQVARGQSISPTDIVSTVACFGIGALLGDYFGNFVGTYLAGNDAYTIALGGKAAFGATSTLLASIMAAAAGLAVPLALRASYEDEAFASLPIVTSENLRQRAGYALLSRGLNEAQVAIALDILAGKSSAEIARSRHYARGTVNSARDTVYKTLGIHSRRELALLLQQVHDV